jgi:thiol-disulfide isomerase/thioredoxin
MRWLPLFVFGVLLTAAPNAIAVEAPSNFALREVPKPLPEIAIADGASNIGALADFRGKFVLLNIWATWCGPCRKEMPTLDRLQGQLGGPNFEVVALSIDRAGSDAVRKFYSEVAIQHLAMHFDAAAEAPFKLGAVGLPTTLLIDRQGREIGRLIGPAEWDSSEMIAFLKTTIAQKAGQLLSPQTQE